MKYKIGIIGNGFVGNALCENFKEVFEVKAWDINPSKRVGVEVCADLVAWADVVFICVPTPQNDDGSCDTSTVEWAASLIASSGYTPYVIIKSTVPPGTCIRLAESFKLKIGFNPEFLTQSNHINDFKFQDLIVLGADDSDTYRLMADLYNTWLSHTHRQCNVIHIGSKEAELYKYVANCFLATKVIFANEIEHLCKNAKIDYEQIASTAKRDKRLGHTHWQVPGPDGQYGYGGACFPKDVSALIKYSQHQNSKLELLSEVANINKFIR